MSNFYEFILYVENNEDVEKKTIQLSNYNTLYNIKQWRVIENDTTDDGEENGKLCEVIFESRQNIYNFIIENYRGQKINKLYGYIKTPIYL